MKREIVLGVEHCTYIRTEPFKMLAYQYVLYMYTADMIVFFTK